MVGHEDSSSPRFRHFRYLVLAWFVWAAITFFFAPVWSAVLFLIGIPFAILLYFRWSTVRETGG